MDNFVYSNPVRMLFGEGQIENLTDEISKYGNKILFVYGQGHIKETGLYDQIVKELKQAGIEWVELQGVQPNPRVSLVREGIELCVKEDIEFILGVGGGSTSDTAKAIGMGVKVDYDIWQAYEDFHHLIHQDDINYHIPEDTLPTGIVITKPGTGSDFDYTSVLSNQETNEKLMVINKTMYPKFSIIEPNFAYSLPQKERVYGVADIMTHILEQYFAPIPDIDILDEYKEANLRVVIDKGKIVKNNPEDYDAQAHLFYIASWACSDQSMTGTQGGWDSHMIEHEFSAITDLNHGHGMAIVYYGWMKYMLQELEAIPWKFAQFAKKVWGVEQKGRSNKEVGLEGIEKTADYWRELGIDLSLKGVGIGDDVIQQAAEQAVRFGPIGVLGPLDKQDVLNIFKMVK